MPAKGDRLLGEDLAHLSLKVPKSALPFIEAHLREMQRASRWQRIGKSDCLRDIFMRGIDSIEHPPAQFPVVLDAPQLPLPTPRVEPAATSAGGAIPPAPAYEARALTPDLTDDDDDQPLGPEPPLTMEPPDVTQASAVPDAQTEDVRPRRGRPARPKAAVAATSQAKPKRTTRTTKGRK